jgi:hypothetical protein
MNDFKALLMPFSFLRRWSCDELIPALLCFDRVTFLMDDIEPRYISDKYHALIIIGACAGIGSAITVKMHFHHRGWLNQP